MKKVKTTLREPDMQSEYDFRGGVRGKYAARYAEGTNAVLLEPDVAALFPDSEAVNEALRALVAIVTRRPRARKIPSGGGEGAEEAAIGAMARQSPPVTSPPSPCPKPRFRKSSP